MGAEALGLQAPYTGSLPSLVWATCMGLMAVRGFSIVPLPFGGHSEPEPRRVGLEAERPVVPIWILLETPT